MTVTAPASDGQPPHDTPLPEVTMSTPLPAGVPAPGPFWSPYPDADLEEAAAEEFAATEMARIDVALAVVDEFTIPSFDPDTEPIGHRLQSAVLADELLGLAS